MRIGHFSKYLAGGAAEYAKTLSDGLNTIGHDSNILSQESFAGVGYSNRSAAAHFANRVRGRFFQKIQKTVFHATNRFREDDVSSLLRDIDLVHVHHVTNWMGLRNLMSAIPETTPVVMTLHDRWLVTGGCVVYNGCEEHRKECERCPALIDPFSRFVATRQLMAKQRCLDRPNIHFVANSEWTYQQLQGATVVCQSSSIQTIVPSYDSTVFYPRSNESFRNQLGIREGTFVIGCGAAVITDANKDLSAAIRIAAQVSCDRKVMVLVFGEGSLDVPHDLNVRFLGPITNRNELACIYNASDVFVSTSLFETYGLTLVEAMACRVPVVAFDTGAIASVLDDGRAGVLVPLGDEETMVRELNKMADWPLLCEDFADKGFQLVKLRNSRSRLVQQHIELYESALRIARQNGC